MNIILKTILIGNATLVIINIANHRFTIVIDINADIVIITFYIFNSVPTEIEKHNYSNIVEEIDLLLATPIFSLIQHKTPKCAPTLTFFSLIL